MARKGGYGNYGGGLYGGDARGLYSSGGSRNMMIYGKPPRRWPKFLLVIVVILIIAACVWQFACGGLPFLKGGSDQQQTEQAEKQEQQSGASLIAAAIQAAQPQTSGSGTVQPGLNTTIQVTAVGDITLGDDVDMIGEFVFDAIYAANDDEYFGQRVSKYTAADQLTVGNLEGPLTSIEDMSGEAWQFRGPVEYANILNKASIEAVNLANDHSYDYGKEGYEETKKVLEEKKVSNFGWDRNAVREVNGVKVGMFGINCTDGMDHTQLVKDDIKSLQDEGCALIIGCFHWGEEGSYDASESQQTLAHTAVDSGCDLVIGTHPHYLQGVEFYKDRYICYSVGNFIYGGNTAPSDYDTVMFQQTFTFADGKLVVSEAQRASGQIIPCHSSTSSENNSYQPIPLGGDDAKALIEKLNAMSAKLSGDGVEFATSLNDLGAAQAK